jgi:hypothetical protein
LGRPRLAEQPLWIGTRQVWKMVVVAGKPWPRKRKKRRRKRKPG